MQLAASLQQSHLIKGGGRQATGPEPAAGLVLAYRRGLLVYGRRISSGKWCNKWGWISAGWLSAATPLSVSPKFPLYLLIYCLLGAGCHAALWGQSSGQYPHFPKPLRAPSNDFCLSFRPRIIWLPSHSFCYWPPTQLHSPLL